MTKKFTMFAAVILMTGLPAGMLQADQPSPAELRLREALKNTMLQLRTAQNDLATLQATQAENDQKVKTLTDQVAAVTQQSAADKITADKVAATANAKIAAQEKLIADFKDAQDKWKASYALAAETAKTKEAERAKLASQVILLQRRVDDLQTKNNELFKVGSEILTRYEKFGLGQALLAKEPFTGIARAKLESQVQDYQDKLTDQKNIPK